MMALSSVASAEILGERSVSGNPTQGNPIVVTINLKNTENIPVDVEVKEKIDSDLKITGLANIETVQTGFGTSDRNIVWNVNIPALSNLEIKYTATKENSLPLTLHETQISYSGKKSTIISQVIQTTCTPNGVCDFGETNLNCPQDCTSTSSCTLNSDCSVGTKCGKGLYYPIICYDGLCIGNSEKCDLPVNNVVNQENENSNLEIKQSENYTLIIISISFVILVVIVALLVARKAKKDRLLAERQQYQNQYNQQQQPPILR